MRLFRFTRQHPIALLGAVAIAFVGWVWWDALSAIRSPNPTVQVTGPPRKPMPTAPDEAIEIITPTHDSTDAVRVLAKLKPGMTRAEVEKLVGAPAPDLVSAATITDGRVTYHTAYEADLGPPATVRPIRPTRPLPAVRDPDPTGRTLITLEFDATKPGHPLLSIHYPDPLF